MPIFVYLNIVAVGSDHRGRILATGKKGTPIRDIASTVHGRKERGHTVDE
jgi:hypothetical protein